MNILCAGINHRLAPVEVRERFAVGDPEMPQVLERLCKIEGTVGVVVVSTCNRVEFYAATICPGRMLVELRAWLRERSSVDVPLYEYRMPLSVRHLFRVSCGLDSMVIGETEILGQIKKAYAMGVEERSLTGHLHRLFQNAFRVAKAVRSQTCITRGATSVGAVAVELAQKIFGNLENRKVMILGAGETSERTAKSLLSRGVHSVIVSNRTFSRAAKLAEEIGGMAIPFDEWQNVFEEVDILIGSTGAPHPVITKEKLLPMMERRRDRPLFVIDLAVPRDVTPDVNEIDGVFLYDIDSLQEIANESLEVRRQEVERCEKMIDSYVVEYMRWLRKSGDFVFEKEGREERGLEEGEEERDVRCERMKGVCE